MVNACNSSTEEAEAQKLRLILLHSELRLDWYARDCLKKKKKTGNGKGKVAVLKHQNPVLEGSLSGSSGKPDSLVPRASWTVGTHSVAELHHAPLSMSNVGFLVPTPLSLPIW